MATSGTSSFSVYHIADWGEDGQYSSRWEQKAEQEIRQEKWIGVLIWEDAWLICGVRAKKVGPTHLPDSRNSIIYIPQLS